MAHYGAAAPLGPLEMILFAVPVAEPEGYARYAEPGIRAAAEPDSVVLAHAGAKTIARSYNILLKRAATYGRLEAAVLLHPHTEIADPSFLTTVRAHLADPDVAVVGCAGAAGVRSVAWWDGEVSTGRVVHRYTEFRGGEVPAYAWAAPRPAPAEVDAVDGSLLVLSPWAVQELRFDETLHPTRGYDVEYCLRARDAGRKVVVADVGVVLHRTLQFAGDPELFAAAHLALAERRGGFADEHTDWKARARRAEAARDARRAEASFSEGLVQARVEELERDFAAATSTLGWRLTEPLRRARRVRR